MDFKKNDVVRLRIEDLSTEGEGIGKAEGFTLFVKDALPGEEIEAKIMKLKKNYGFARLERILQESPYRVEPACPHHRRCGGCQLQALSYERQLEFKENKIRNNLIRLGGFAPEEIDSCMEPIVGMDNPYRYRNKAQFPVGRDKEGNIVTGFYAARTHVIIPHLDCVLGVEENQVILKRILEAMKETGTEPYEEVSGTGLIRHVLIRKGFATGELMVCLVINGRKLPRAEVFIEKLCKLKGMTSISLNFNTKKTNVILGDEGITLWGKEYITDYIGDIAYQISPRSFYQVNPVQTKKLYELALEYAGLTGKETVWDLYCGIGTISLFMAKHAKQVYGVEIVPEAIVDARRNAALNGIMNAEFFVGKAEEVVPEFYERENGGEELADERQNRTSGGRERDACLEAEKKEKGRKERKNGAEPEWGLPDGLKDEEKSRENLSSRKMPESSGMLHPDVMVVDPPRKGCDGELLKTMLKMGPERIVYVSCDSATLARDLRVLCDGGYEVKRVRGVDQFGQGVHVETVILMQYCGFEQK